MMETPNTQSNGTNHNQDRSFAALKKDISEIQAKIKEMANAAPANEKKSWWTRQSHEVQIVLAVAGGFTAFVGLCIVGGGVTSAISRNQEKTLVNSDGYKAMIERGLLDPVPPPKTLEEAAARLVLNGPQILTVDAYTGQPMLTSMSET